MNALDLSIDHVTLSVADLSRARAFYGSVLAHVGLAQVADYSAEITGTVNYCGFGKSQKGTFWLAEKGLQTPPFHIAFRAPSRKDVRNFHAAALKAGGQDNGSPGLRTLYHPDYYGAFVLDPEGHNVEAVCFAPEELQ